MPQLIILTVICASQILECWVDPTHAIQYGLVGIFVCLINIWLEIHFGFQYIRDRNHIKDMFDEHK